MVDTPLQAARKFNKAANGIKRNNDRAVLLAAKYVETAIKTKNPESLRNARKRASASTRGAPVKLTLWTTKVPAVAGAGGDARVIAGRGPWQLIEFDTSAHLIGLGRRKRAKRGFMRFPDGEVRMGPVAHPGTHGKHGFRNAWMAASPAVPRIIDAEVKKELFSAFGF